MIRADLYLKIAKQAVFKGVEPPTDDIQDDCKSLNIDRLEDFLNEYRDNNQFTSLLFPNMLEVFNNDPDSLDDDIVSNTYVYVYGVNINERTSVIKDLPFMDDDYVVLPFKCFIDKDTIPEKVWLSFERICTTIYSKDNTLDLFFDNVTSTNKNSIFYCVSNELNEKQHWNFYMYAFIKNVLPGGSGFDIPPILKSVTIPSIAFTYNPSSSYEQFYDVTNALNEAIKAQDILSQFLRIYHILEYFSYRKKIVPLTVGSLTRNSFIRRLQSINKSYNELQSLQSLVKEKFNHWKNKYSYDVFDSNIQKSMSKLFPDIIKDKGLPSVSVWIYGVRCSIAHNKESECHFTLTNETEYETIIPVMKNFINDAIKDIVNLINDVEKTKDLVFENSELRLF